MNDSPRIRRSTSQEPPTPSSGPSIWVIAFFVALVGLAIGGFAGRVLLGKKHPVALPTDSVAVRVTPIPSAAPTEHPVKSPSPRPSHSPSPSPSPRPSPSSSPSSSPRPTSTPEPAPSPTVRPTVHAQVRATPKPSMAPAPTSSPVPPPATPTQRAEATVRSYLAAVGRSDMATAESLLGAGVPSERSFYTSAARIRTMSAELQANGRVKVDVEIDAPSGQYLDTFQLDQGPNGWYIADHYATKV